MIHTAQLFRQLPAKKFFAILNQYKEQYKYNADDKTARDADADDKTAHKSWSDKTTLEKTNTTVKLRWDSKNHINFYFCILKIDLNSLINTVSDRTTIFDMTQVDNLQQAFYNVISSYSELLNPYINHWHCNRIDYCVNIKIDDAALYVRLMKYGNIPYPYQMETNKEGSVYLKSKSRTINIYDKIDEIKKKDKDFNRYAKHDILRIESQTKHRRLQAIKKKNQLDGYNIMEYINPDIAVNEILRVYKVVAGKSDYYSLNEARSQIETLRRRYSKERRNEIIGYLETVSKKHGVVNANRSIEDKEFIESCKNALNKLNINPVTIPEKEGIKYLPNLYYQIYEQIYIE